MPIPRSAEEIRKLELELEELVNKFTNRVKLIREDLKSLVKDIEALKNHIDDRRKLSNDYTREISDLTNDLQVIKSEVNQVESEITSIQTQVDLVNKNASQVQNDLSGKRTTLASSTTESSSLATQLNALEAELASLEGKFAEQTPKHSARINSMLSQQEKLATKQGMLSNRFEAIRVLCRKDYIQTPEVGLVKFLAMKPSSESTLTEVHSALGMDISVLKKMLNQLDSRKILDFSEQKEVIKLLVEIDLFKKEVL